MLAKIVQKKFVLFTVKGIKPIAILEKIALNIPLHAKFCQHILLVKRISNDLGKKREPVQNE